MKMTKKELAASIAYKSGMSANQATIFLNAFLEVVGDVLEKGNDISLAPLGIIGITTYKERMGVNPQTGEKIMRAARKRIKIRTSHTFKRRLAKV